MPAELRGGQESSGEEGVRSIENVNKSRLKQLSRMPMCQHNHTNIPAVLGEQPVLGP